MIDFTAGVMVGMAFGLVLMGMLNLAAYDRGFDAATRRHATWLRDALRKHAGSGKVVSAQRVA